MRTCLPLLLLACTPDPAPPPPLSTPGGTPVLDLSDRPAQVGLPPVQAVLDDLEGRFTLQDPKPATSARARRIGAGWSYALPFEARTDDTRFAPPGLTVTAEGEPLPWRLDPRSGPGWRLDDDALLLIWPEGPPPETLVLTHPDLARRLDRLSPTRAGLAPDAFVRHAITWEDDTREGLLMVAGTRVSWDVTLPEGARLSAAVARVPTGLREGRDPAPITLSVRPGAGEPTPLLEATPEPSGFTPIEADLTAFAGQRLTLTATAGPGAPAFLAHPRVVGDPTGVPPRRVLWIGLDTTRPDHLGLYGHDRPTSPHLDAWAGQATVFTDAVAPAPRTRPSFRSALTGRRPLPAVGAPTLLARLDQAGFATAGIVANIHLNPRFGFSDGADRWRLDPSADAEDQVDRALDWLEEHRHQDAALFLHFMDPHLRYDAPAPFRDRFVADPDPDLPPGFHRAQVLGWQRRGLLDARRRAHIEALHDGEVAYLDDQLGRLFQAVEALPGRTLVVVQSDHGEEFWEHDGFEHNHTLRPEVVDAVMVVRRPGQTTGHRVDVPATLADLLPTVLELLGLPADGVDGRSLLPWLDGTAPADWPERPLGVGHLMYAPERWAVRFRGHTYELVTGTGEEHLFDRTADPGEHVDLVPGPDLAPFRTALAHSHDLDVGPGWRVKVHLAGPPITLHLPAPALDARVLDPEVFRTYRANEVWGETPPVRPDDVATVALSEDRRTLRITPGPHARGTLIVRFDGPTAPAGRVGTAEETVPIQGGPQAGVPGLHKLDVREGTVLVPPLGEAERLAAVLGTLDDVDDATRGLLQELGYLREGANSGGSASTPPGGP
jgi:arylsulfatase A-like enzyme